MSYIPESDNQLTQRDTKGMGRNPSAALLLLTYGGAATNPVGKAAIGSAAVIYPTLKRPCRINDGERCREASVQNCF